jgi:hypothetical protein
MRTDIDDNAKRALQTQIDEVELITEELPKNPLPPRATANGVQRIYATELETYTGTKEDKYGALIEMHRKSGNLTYKIEGKDFEKLKRVAARILKECEIAEVASLRFVQECCFSYKIAHSFADGSCLLEYVNETLEKNVDLFRFEFPIGGLRGEIEFIFGGIEFKNHPMSLEKALPPEEYETQIDPEVLTYIKVQNEQRRSNYDRVMWCSIEVLGEAKFAYERALSHTRDILAILRAFCVRGLVGERFITVEAGDLICPTTFVIVGRGNSLVPSQEIFNRHEIVLLSEDYFQAIWDVGLEIVNDILQKETKSNLESVALDAYRLIGHAVQQRELSDKILFLCAALELVLVEGEKDIVNTLSKRLARILGRSIQERKAIQSNIKKIYADRSKRVHAGKFSDLEESTFEFQEMVLRFIGQLALWTTSHKTKKDLIDHIENLFMKD